jgi:hypothetical protein
VHGLERRFQRARILRLDGGPDHLPLLGRDLVQDFDDVPGLFC